MVAVSHPVIWTIVSSHGKAKVNTTQFESSRSTFSLPGQPLMQHTFDRSRPLHILSHAQLRYIIIVYTRRDAPSRHHYNEITGRTECAYASSVNNNTNRQPLGDNLRVHLSNIWPILTLPYFFKRYTAHGVRFQTGHIWDIIIHAYAFLFTFIYLSHSSLKAHTFSIVQIQHSKHVSIRSQTLYNINLLPGVSSAYSLHH